VTGCSLTLPTGVGMGVGLAVAGVGLHEVSGDALWMRFGGVRRANGRKLCPRHIERCSVRSIGDVGT
jgi:hypothetical protein